MGVMSMCVCIIQRSELNQVTLFQLNDDFYGLLMRILDWLIHNSLGAYCLLLKQNRVGFPEKRSNDLKNKKEADPKGKEVSLFNAVIKAFLFSVLYLRKVTLDRRRRQTLQ